MVDIPRLAWTVALRADTRAQPDLQDVDDDREVEGRGDGEDRVDEQQADRHEHEQEHLRDDDQRGAEQARDRGRHSAGERVQDLGRAPALHVEQLPAEDDARQACGDVGLTVREEPEHPTGEQGRDHGLEQQEQHGHGRDDPDLLGRGQVLHPEPVDHRLQLRGQGVRVDARDGQRADEADQRDADEVEDAQAHRHDAGEHEQSPVGAGQERQRRPHRLDDRAVARCLVQGDSGDRVEPLRHMAGIPARAGVSLAHEEIPNLEPGRGCGPRGSVPSV